MNDFKTYECECGNECRAPKSGKPDGWDWVGDKLNCTDCMVTHRANGGQHPTAQDIPATPVDTATSIKLLSGAYLDLANPDCSVITPIDVAAGLRQARFSAQTGQFYTIAQHSVLVLQLVEPLAKRLGGKRGAQLRRCALMHDAAEAFIHDITRPLKILLPDYRRVEAVMERGLERQFGFEWTGARRDQVKRADIEALAIEQRDLMGNTDPWPVLQSVDRDQLDGFKITRAWHPDEAQDRFLSAFRHLFPNDERKAA